MQRIRDQFIGALSEPEADCRSRPVGPDPAFS
jgi:hypothetical protein